MSSELKVYLKTVGFRGLLNALTGKITNTPVLQKIHRKECRHAFRLRVPSSDVPTCEQVFVNLDYEFQVAAQPRIIVDAGANIGLASIYFANKYPKARIIAIEPEASNFGLLKQNLAPYPKATAVQAALWHQNKEITIVDPGLGNWGFIAQSPEQAGGSHHKSRHRVMAITVDKVLEDFDLPQIDILKIDIEGAEKEVFSDTSAWIDRVDAIIIELHERYKRGCNRSFYCGTKGFDFEWTRGENVFLSRGNLLEVKETR